MDGVELGLLVEGTETIDYMDTYDFPYSIENETAWWSFYEGEDSTAHGLTENDIDGTIYGATWTEGIVGKSGLYFDGGDYISMGNPEELQITGSMSICMWLNPDDFSVRRNSFAKAYGGEGTITQETNGYLSYYYGTNGGNGSPYQGFSTSTPISLNDWNLVCIVYIESIVC